MTTEIDLVRRVRELEELVSERTAGLDLALQRIAMLKSELEYWKHRKAIRVVNSDDDVCLN